MKTQECWDTTGSPPISTKWVDVNKGDQQDYDIRCRLVAREMGGGKSDEFYAPTPPLEAKRLLFSEAATNRRFGKHEKKLLFIDVRKAYFNAKVDRPTLIELPPEMQWAGHCGRLIRCMYGTKSAAMRWEDTYTQALGRLGFAQGRERLLVALPTRRATFDSSSTVTTSPCSVATKTSTTSSGEFRPSST